MFNEGDTVSYIRIHINGKKTKALGYISEINYIVSRTRVIYSMCSKENKLIFFNDISLSRFDDYVKQDIKRLLLVERAHKNWFI